MQLSQQISFGLHEILKTTAANIHTTEDWTTIFALLEYVGAGKVPSGPITQVSVDIAPRRQETGSDPSLNNLDKPAGLQHSQSQDPIPAPLPVGYSSGSDRGYTSDSELEIRSQNSDARLSGVSPAQSWILLTHSTPEETSANTPNSPSKTAKSLIQERQQFNFSPDSKSLMKSCETLSFLVRDAAHITPDNFTICVQAIRSFVEACTLRPVSNKQKGMDGNRKLKRGKKHHSSEQGHTLPKSKSFPVHSSSPYDADYESDPEADQAAASHHVSIQVFLKKNIKNFLILWFLIH